MESLTLAQARRIALTAAGFADPHPRGTPDLRHLRRVVGRLGQIQIDSVNILARAHYLPLYSRLGPYPLDLLERASTGRRRTLFEYWGHEASLIDVNLHPHLRWRMAQPHPWGAMRRIGSEQPELVTWVLDEVRANGPLTARQIEHDAPRRRDHWGWNWTLVKQALEHLFWAGAVSVIRRNAQFERVYDLTERTLPEPILAVPTPTEASAHRTLVEVAAGSLGVATEADLRDYFRLAVAPTRVAVAELVEAGTLLPVRVPGWTQPAWLHAQARLPRRVRATTLVSPFDPLVWERSRTERLFGFRYRIEIYVPAAQRVHGYYVLPFLQEGELVARVDLKADRAAGTLRTPAAWIEPGRPVGEVADALAAELHRLAEWVGCGEVAPPERGDLAPALAAALKAAGAPADPLPPAVPVTQSTAVPVTQSTAVPVTQSTAVPVTRSTVTPASQASAPEARTPALEPDTAATAPGPSSPPGPAVPA